LTTAKNLRRAQAFLFFSYQLRLVYDSIPFSAPQHTLLAASGDIAYNESKNRMNRGIQA